MSKDNNNHTNGIPVHNSAAMKLLDIRLKPSTAIVTSLIGSFTQDAPTQEIAMLKPGGLIEIHRIDTSSDDDDDDDESPRVLQLQCRTETRSVLRSAAKIRYPGERRDLLAVSSDSGAISILDFENSKMKIVHCVDYGKTGCRRDTPGQYIAAESRAVMVAAVEKRRLVYVLNRDATGNPTIASPLEAHRSRTITYCTVALDNGHSNPIFATIEYQYPDLETEEEEVIQTKPVKELAYYELDLGLNHVSRRWATKVLPTTICMASIPGGAEGPGGVFLGAEDYIQYLHEGAKIVCAIPRRRLHPAEKGILVTHISVHRQKKAKFFALAQTELGDVYKITVVLNPDNKKVITGMKIALLDTLPVASSLNISDLGLLFASAEFGNHQLYQFLGIDLPDAPTSVSEDLEKAKAESDKMDDDDDTFYTTAVAAKVAPTFDPTVLKNLAKLSSLDNSAPTTAVMVGELAGNEVSPQIYTLTGRGPHSQLSITRHGASVTELAVSDLPGVPGGIFTVEDNTGDSNLDRYIVVSFVDATLVLSVGESVEEVGKESEFVTDAPTLACSALGKDGSLCQVHPKGVRHINKGQPTKQWNCRGLKQIECAAANEGQVMIALAGGEIIYFELDAMSGGLSENETREMGVDVCCLDVGTIAKGRNRSMFAAIGCRDQTVRIVTLAPNGHLAQKSSTALKSRPHSVTLHAMGSDGNDDLTLMIGLEDGSSLRVPVDPITGSIGSSPTRRFLGARPVSVSRISMDSQPGILMLSSRPWVSRCDPTSGKHVMAPLSYAPLDHGCSFRSDAVREGIIATSGKTLRILAVDASGMSSNDDEAFNTKHVGLGYTPRQMALVSTAGVDPITKRKIALVVAESDYNEYGLEEKKAMGFDSTGEGKNETSGGSKGDDDAMDMDEDSDNEGGQEKKESADDDDDEVEDKKTAIRGPVPPGPGYWGSCIRLLDTSNNCESLDCVEMGRNEAALCCASVRFHSKGGEALLAVGTATGMTLQPMKHTTGHIVLYRILNGERFQLLHRTSVDDGPILAMAHFQGRLIVGIGKSLRLYEMGKRQLLRKCELRGLPSVVKTIQTLGDRAYVGDLLQSMRVVKYDISSNRLILIAIDANPRPIVAEEILDTRTVAISDKFGNISILRLPKGAENGSATAMDTSGDKALWEAAREDAVPKLELLCQYYVGEVVTSMTNAPLVAGGPESLIYVTASGRIGALLPLSSRDQVDFFTKLYGEIRSRAPKPTGRDPWSYRSYYAPAMHVIDGELCDSFNALPHSDQLQVAEALELSIGQIVKKIEDTRNALL